MTSSIRVYSTLFLILLLQATYLQPQVTATQPIETKAIGGFCLKFRVHVMNALSSNVKPLFLNCWSEDDDLGSHRSFIGGDFNFKFGVSVFGKTKFTCDFQWDKKKQHIDVFNDDVEGTVCCETGTCFWKAQDDGIYFSVDGLDFNKKFNWLIGT